MEISFEYTNDKVEYGVTLMANGVYVGDLLDVPAGNWVNWCAIQGEFKCKFALRNEDTFDLILDEIKSYCIKNEKTGIVISSYSSGGIRGFYDDDFWIGRGFYLDQDSPSALMFLKVS